MPRAQQETVARDDAHTTEPSQVSSPRQASASEIGSWFAVLAPGNMRQDVRLFPYDPEGKSETEGLPRRTTAWTRIDLGAMGMSHGYSGAGSDDAESNRISYR
ncbi:hypothetical protein Prum_092660 [Phytohabitans rumicis]|uniref:Uncharacterized protein n=1 Tax=Phytohabitans rumicis TaxID=1076125 RepID=A0A6V8LHA6_9ACTN|nr:hypothetical protein Prum_092660 [Phytohabitans rumicis]